jgi:NADH dehydrogenase [ubiquinone] 1 alpha subcomplex assembly factor 7
MGLAGVGQGVTGSLEDALRRRIRQEGPMAFSQWMEACLYDPVRGFYAQARHPAGTGPGTHFATSPTLHPFFAKAVAAELGAAWRAAGKPERWRVVEFGAGTGALAQDAARGLREERVPVEWIAVDLRPGAAQGVTWSRHAPTQYDAAVAHEFLDALPFDVARWDGGWQELRVGLDGDSFAWHAAPWRGADLGEGDEGELRVVAASPSEWLQGVASSKAKAALVVDYGGQAPASSVRAFRDHGHADPLDAPGRVDITADVDFAALAREARSLGFEARLESQEAFLLRHGILDALNALDRDTVEGASSYLRLRQLLLPTGFGAAFKVLNLRRPRSQTVWVGGGTVPAIAGASASLRLGWWHRSHLASAARAAPTAPGAAGCTRGAGRPT